MKGLDRVMYAGLTKKNVERSKWRYLSEKEIRLLKYMNESKKRTNKIPMGMNDSVAEDIETIIQEKTNVPVEKMAPKKIKEKKLTDKEIGEAIGEPVPASKKEGRIKEAKIPQARKFKTHSEKKKFKLNNVGKK